MTISNIFLGDKFLLYATSVFGVAVEPHNPPVRSLDIPGMLISL